MPPPDVGVHNTTGAVTRRYTDPYGNPRGTTPTAWAGDHGFLDKPTDTTGLTAIGARYYDSLIARFVSVDPVMDLTDPQQWNAYIYANGNPVTWSDPTGLWPDWLDDAASAVGDGISTAWNATTTWVDEHQADIVAGVAGTVVGAGCLVLTAGWESRWCKGGHRPMDVQDLLAGLRTEALRSPDIGVTWADASDEWRTARLGMEYRGGFVELLEDNLELCFLAGAKPARPLLPFLPDPIGSPPEVVLAFALGVAVGSGGQ